MNDATRSADNIRRDIGALTQRYAIVDRDEKCGVILFLVIMKMERLYIKCKYCFGLQCKYFASMVHEAHKKY